jgi:hypothetical protein
MNKDSYSLLSERYIYDMLKRDFDVFDRADIIREYLGSSGLSQAKFCEKFGIPETTLHTWLLFGARISKEEYNKQLDMGVSKTTLFKTLRGDKSVASTELEVYLQSIISKIREYKRASIKVTPVTYTAIDLAVNELNQLAVDLRLKERKEKRK